MKRKILVTVLSLGLAMQMPLVAYASETLTTQQSFSDGGTHTVDSNINLGESNLYALSVSGNSQVTVNGNIEGAAGVLVTGGSATINGDVTSVPSGNLTGLGVHVENGTVNVNGSIKGIGGMNQIESGGRLVVSNNIEGDVILKEGAGSLTVTNGNVYDSISFASDSKAVINGNVKYVYFSGDTEINQSKYENLRDRLPDIVLYSVDRTEGISGSNPNDTAEQAEWRRSLSVALNNNIKYIIRMAEGSGDRITVSGYSNSDGYNVAKAGQTLTVNPTATVDDGYELVVTAGQNSVVTKNEDGTYTIVVGAKGGVTINATIRQIIQAVESGAISVDEGESVVVEIEDFRDPNAAPAGAIVIASAANADEALSELAPLSNVPDAVTPARVVSYKISELTPYQYINSVLDNAAATPEGETLRINVDRVSCFSLEQMQSFDNNGIGVELIYVDKGQRKRVRIPANYDMESLLRNPDGTYKGFLGYNYLASVFGFTVIDQ